MNRFILLGKIAALVSASALGQSGGSYTMMRHAVGAGAASSSGPSGYMLKGTEGQVEATRLVQTGGVYSLTGGFWQPFGNSQSDLIFKDGFE